ncbi:MAG: hypothetical protein ACHQNE_01675 [Candidatus Kapaibacterium sp.]
MSTVPASFVHSQPDQSEVTRLLTIDELAANLQLGWTTDRVISEMKERFRNSDTLMSENLDVEGHEVIQALRFAPVTFNGCVGLLTVGFDRRGHAEAYVWGREDASLLSAGLYDLLNSAGIYGTMQADGTLKQFVSIVSGLSLKLGKAKRLHGESQEVAIWKSHSKEVSVDLKEGALSFAVWPASLKAK